jgi:hypothetical protein
MVDSCSKKFKCREKVCKSQPATTTNTPSNNKPVSQTFLHAGVADENNSGMLITNDSVKKFILHGILQSE